MSLVHELEKSGNWLFRRRSWLPATMLVPAAFYLFIANRSVIYFNYTWEIICILVSVTGLLLRSYTIGYLPRSASERNLIDQMADELNTKGIYSVIRHPLYVGNILMSLGPVLFLRSVWWVIVFVLASWLYYERIIFAGEQYLRRKFGEAYDTWAFRVKAVIPSFRHYVKPDLPFSFRNVIRREYKSIANLFLVFAFLDLCRNIAVTGRIYLEPMYVTLLVAALIFWAVIRYIIKRTKFLYVGGR
ncbi:MAG TPA: isoprenylcysteine carboxylmethyltransferase family protein [Bacteroidales bacterium]|jgi:protein-S-isoprenylcysteine O-methyltransferase Ste14|nr:lipid A Kdo2 1-phosphate O-methyltransferase [Bacteroidales bacterium]MDI9533424.1 isoprenylcysteine carboxylmethyltransferase family protein [Bacteroidota bacterium]OPZ58012.1 MAG: Isoprenylcysteine carboxyl methyltransferase (ICMT) family protein [Bacteroidetes bacterium ADurb.BinA012]MBK7732770.1 lipid A Kdo2 1-phosphate O-methyltransferase [Bacteroidales bacterium]MBP7035909.1 lipid A phosphate methyltransferase [Bacteroidales bacterium]